LTRPGEIIVRDSLYWIPLMVALHGLRREEAAQLRVHHIKSFGVTIGGEARTIWYFDLTAEDLVLKEPANGSPRQAAPPKVHAYGFSGEQGFRSRT
jgi:hypothetical protein